MITDQTNQTLVLKDGRRLGFAEYGTPTGRPVFHFHGAGSSRLEHPAQESILFANDIRFISVDRPGHGLSDYQPDRRILDWPHDIRQLADHLGIHQFYVEGYSAGGPYALACAYQFPDQVMAGAAISSAAPMHRPGAYKGLPLPNQILAMSSRWIPWFAKLIRRMMRSMILGDAEKSARQLMSSIPESDKTVLYAPENARIFVSSVREGFRTGSKGVAVDDILTNQKWGFDLARVQPRIDIWQGEADVNVPIHAAVYLQNALPRTRTTFLPGEGHMLIFKRWAEILSALVSEK
jgi:pimeloyl-ACP methyl ester carboxylesterase